MLSKPDGMENFMEEKTVPKNLQIENIPKFLSILPVMDTVLFPKMVLPLEVTSQESIHLVEDAIGSDRIIGLLAVKNPEKESGFKHEDLYTVGTSGFILKMVKSEDNKAQLLMQGLGRFKVTSFHGGKPYLRGFVEHFRGIEAYDKEIEAISYIILGTFQAIVQLHPALPPEIYPLAASIIEPGTLADMIVSVMNVSAHEAQKILETADIKTRLKEAMRLASRQLEFLELGYKIHTRVKGDIDKQEREYYLREQLKAIRAELGDVKKTEVSIEHYKQKIEEKGFPDEVAKEAQRELNRLARMNSSSAEFTVAITYLDWLTTVPWKESTQDNLDVGYAKKILDQDHHGLEKPKQRIIEYLSVRKLRPDSKGPILCFAGPPGTGKTSLGRSIARAMGRNFVKMSLGGVRDEAEIRGHRRTYVGALPGRIIQGLRRAGSNNPVFMLDEIDKTGKNFGGDPSSALLEVLDPEQNHSFSDHYLDVAFDLSKVMFITTANTLYHIPEALRDRMEVIGLSGYSLDEKAKIAKGYLIPRQLEGHGINKDQLTFTPGAIRLVISGYTREAGVRNLEREIAAICRVVASKIANGEIQKFNVRVKNVSQYLGPTRFASTLPVKTMIPGIAIGLACSDAGGEIMTVEAFSMKGNQGLTLTGRLGEVMKESAITALSYVRSNATKLGIDEKYYDSHDIHVHIPAGSVEKEGSGAGLPILVALVSLLTGRICKKNLAMTGEISLRGQVLPVESVIDKVLAAHRANMKAVILPKENEKDLLEIPRKVHRDIRFYFVNRMSDAIKIALTQK
jgi:ATP-dependent Lon protease